MKRDVSAFIVDARSGLLPTLDAKQFEEWVANPPADMPQVRPIGQSPKGTVVYYDAIDVQKDSCDE